MNDDVIIPVSESNEIESHNSNQEKDKPHKGKPITRLEVSPNGEYVVTYSEDDHSIVGWDTKKHKIDDETAKEDLLTNEADIDEGQLKPDNAAVQIKTDHETTKDPKKTVHHQIKQICVSDDKKLAYIYTYDNRNYLRIIDMNNKNEIKLYFSKGLYPYYCTFNLKNDFILCANVYENEMKNINNKNIDHYIWTYSTQTENNKWNCKGIYKLPRDFEIINISKYDKLYLLSDNYIYEWNILTENMIRSIFVDVNVKEENEEEDEEEEEEEDNKKEEDEEKEINKEEEEDKEKEEYNGKEEEGGNEKNKHKTEDIEIEDIKITSNEKFICLRIKDKVTIYSTVLGIPIASLDVNDGIQQHQLYNLMKHSGLYPLLPPSLPSLFEENFCKKCLDRLKEKESSLTGDQIKNFQTTSNYVFGILDSYVWKLKFDFRSDFGFEKLNDNENENKIIKSWNGSDELNKKINEETYLNLHLFTDMDTLLNQELVDFITEYIGFEHMMYVDEYEALIELFIGDKICIKVPIKDKHMVKEFIYIKVDEDKIIDKVPQTNMLTGDKIKEIIYINIPTKILMDDKNEPIKIPINENELKQGLIKIKTNCSRKKFELEVFKINTSGNEWKWKSICKKIEKCNFEISIFKIKLFNNNDITILTDQGLFIYYFNENSKSISLNYFYSVGSRHMVKYYKQVVKSKSTLPIPNHNSFKFNGWVEYLKSNKESFLKYGVELMTFAIKEHKQELVQEIYEKCIKYFQDDVNNEEFLSIITSTMPLLEEYYPEFISKYSSATDMIIDSPFYKEKRQNTNLHLHSFFPNSQILNLTQSIPYTKFNYNKNYDSSFMKVIQLLLLPFILPIVIFFIVLLKCLTTFSNFHFINDLYKCNLFSVIYFYILDKISTIFPEHKLRPTITFMVPYIKFINYPQDYNWFLDWIKPQSSPFIETMHSKEIYKTWSGEALINFKWNTYGKYYYYTIWIGFVALLGCFTIAATIPQEYLSENKRKILLITSIILGFIHLTFEVRQFIYNINNPIEWIKDFWKCFDVVVYALPTFTAIYWLRTDDINNRNEPIVTLLSYSCLFLDLKLLLFFKVYESYGRYFAITISVAKKVYIFLIVFLTIIMMSFAHAFHILLSPKKAYSFKNPLNNGDPNNPWELTSSYQVFNKDGSNTDLYVVQEPDENTNLFADYRTSLYAVSLFLTGDLTALSGWKFEDNPTAVILVIFFTFLTVIYLLNVFIGLFTEVINDDNLKASQLILKAEILAKIELFYLSPHQRRWKEWFPRVIYYYANMDETRERVKAMIQNNDKKFPEWDGETFPKMKQDLLEILNIDKPNSVNETLLQELLEKYLNSKKQN